MQIIPGQYFQCIKDDRYGDDEDGEIAVPKGELVLITSIDAENVHFNLGEKTYHSTFDDFNEHYEFDADGERKRADEITRLMRESTDFSADQKAIETAMANISVSTTSLVKSNDPQAAKKQLGMAKGAIIRLQESVLEKQERLMGFLKEKEAFMMAKVAAMNEMVEKVTDVVWAINIYVGTDEDIKQLKAGEPAPETEKVHVRQLRLFMDEELAIRDDKGGMDWQDLDTFDKWIVEPDHLQQILPEQRGIVALRVRRDDKKYSEKAIENEALNKNNRITYILARNGENLYRIWSSLDVGEVLFPRRDEFADIFMDYSGNPLHPGTVKYENAMKSADKNRKHYMRMVLFLQGIFDRTNFFHPFAKPGVNITNRKECEDVITFIHDAEMQLSDGRPSFRDWLSELNSKLTVGSRIVGWFGSSYFPVYTNSNVSRYDLRVSPPGNAPKDEEIYLLEKRERDGFNFFFDRKGKKWDRYMREEVEFKRRATGYVEPTDGFIINFDDLIPDDITYYLGSRLHRDKYREMFPLLKRARAMKEQELKEEAPFIDLLVGQIVKEFGASIAEAKKSVPALVKWWKFKTRWTRALKSNDRKALSMIVQQYGLNAQRETDLKKRDRQVQPVVDAILSKHPTAVFIGHKDKNVFVALIPANDQNIFVHEQTWRFTQEKAVVLDAEKCWVLLDKRRDNWRKLYAADRWAHWESRHHISEVLTDPEREKLIEDALASYKKRVEERESYYRRNTDGDLVEKTLRYLPLAVTNSNERNELLIWAGAEIVSIPRKHHVYHYIPDQTIERVEIHWKRTPSGITHCISIPGGGYRWHPKTSKVDWMDVPHEDRENHPDNWEEDELPWSDKWRDHGVYRSWPENLEILRSEFMRRQAFVEKSAELTAIAGEAVDILEAKWKAETTAKLYAKFISENDPHLWAAEVKAKNIDSLRYKQSDELSKLLYALVDMGVPVMGKTLGWCLERARGKKAPMQWRQKSWHEKKDSLDLPTAEQLPGLELDWVIQKEEALVEASK